MTPGFRYITQQPIDAGSSVVLFEGENQNIQYTGYSGCGVGITYVIDSDLETSEKISELIRFKFDCGISVTKTILVWTTIETKYTRAVSCEDIESDSKRFFQLSEYLIKGVK